MDLLAQARIKGVQSEFVDALGKLRVTDPVALKSILDALPEKRVYRFVSGPVVVRALGHPRTELATIGAPPLKWKMTAQRQCDRARRDARARDRLARRPAARLSPADADRCRRCDAKRCR